MYVEDDYEEETLSINHDNIFLQGFINLLSTDGEAEIRSKIGDAVRLKHVLVGNRDLVCQLWRVLVRASETALQTRSYLC